MNEVMVLLLITWSKSPIRVACSCRRWHDGGRERDGTPAEKEEAQEKKEFVNQNMERNAGSDRQKLQACIVRLEENGH